MSEPDQNPMADAAAIAAKAPAPGGLTPYLSLSDAAAASAFYQTAFAAEEAIRIPGPDGKRLIHCHLTINGAHLFVNDAFPDFGHPLEEPKGYALHLAVDHVQPWFDRAIAAGCTAVTPPRREFWGDWFAQLRDPFGVSWSIGGKEP
ncbi:VOC family protein [Oharaeibacter diazotrophicus]|uniref:Putative glyoxalase superfamily protein PhnB n=1 Tax=Oharaeibacter diazotrophicus TaxID=1920512 RepID=A0A4R6RFJ6_9HYPH|nr:glyoxalase/bleomycin resistance/extradiol dioxygenase family protein [Oharaeibacter diazotrophicus]TDP85083.1 putative glyoxalase superfamily protein PhnB [Oharaeibacter diazotrophicus]BBE74053.1 hypothetical protein OHA_1_03679 [Pleomorphomonas sp. SM30]GLS76258.1 hypothetical protein GCM10007904_15930 [Oharaeibacter diazotrophicus]